MKCMYKIACAFFLLSSCMTVGYAQSIVQVIPLPNTTYWNQAWGLAADSTRLYISSGTSTTTVYNYGFIYTTNHNGVPIDSVNPSSGYSQGLAYDGTYFYYVRRYTAACAIYKLTRQGTLIDSLRWPSNRYLGGACWDGTHLWVSDYTSTSSSNPTYLYKINWATKSVVDSIQTIGLQPQGIAWDGQYLYYAMDLNSSEPNQNLIYVVNPVTRDTVRTIPMPEGPTTDSNPRGLAWDGRYLWLIAEPVGASSGRSLYKYDLSGSGTPDIDITSLVDFSGTRIGSQKTVQVSLSNVGTAPLTIDSVRIVLSTQFTTTFATPTTIPANSSVQFPLTFAPTTFGRDSASVRIYSNDPDEGLKIVAARGFGIYGTPLISVPSNYDFNARRVGSSNSWLMTIQNLGGPTLSISAITTLTNAFRIDPVNLPLSIDSLGSAYVRVWFLPTAGVSYSDTLKITSNASNGPVTSVALSGLGDVTPIPIGQPFWTFTVPNNPRTSSNQKLVKGVRAISDITGDGKPDVVISTENYWTMALNGNASVSNDSLWAFNTYIANYSAGSIGATGDYSHQKALSVADLNLDGYKDVIIGTDGGNEHVYAINGRSGQILWQFGTDHPDSFSLGDFTGVDASRDFNGDNVPDVLAAASATEVGGVGGRRSMYLFNGANGNILWQSPLLGFTHGVAAIGDVSGDGVPDAVGCVGEPSYKASAFSGANGALLWDFAVPSGSGGGKEVLAWPVANQTPDVIVSAFWGPVYRVDGESGTQIWSRPTGGSGVMQLVRLRDVTGDGVDEVLAPLLGGGIYCINGANGNIVWSLPTGNTMGAAAIPDLNNDGYDDVAIAVQNEGTRIVKGQDGTQMALYATGTAQSREVAVVPDIDGNNSFEIIMGGREGNVALLSGGLDAGTDVQPVAGLPREFELGQNYPNPFNPTTTISISLPVQSDVSLTIYDLLGREVRSFVYERVPAGTHQVVWDGKNRHGVNAASGVYYYQLRAGTVVKTRSMVLVR